MLRPHDLPTLRLTGETVDTGPATLTTNHSLEGFTHNLQDLDT
jgi:hypothetical protein